MSIGLVDALVSLVERVEEHVNSRRRTKLSSALSPVAIRIERSFGLKFLTIEVG